VFGFSLIAFDLRLFSKLGDEFLILSMKVFVFLAVNPGLSCLRA
jgi:hypothetical protein